MRSTRTLAVLFALVACGTAVAMAQAAPARPQVSRTPHRTLGKTDCLSCHGIGANEHVSDVPATEHNFTNATCMRCHRAAATMPSRSQHEFDNQHARCQACHVAGNTVNAQPTPANHTRYDRSTCIMCHEPQSVGAGS